MDSQPYRKVWESFCLCFYLLRTVLCMAEAHVSCSPYHGDIFISIMMEIFDVSCFFINMP